jgi:uncharacterized protein YbjT (DUF2867 family)
VSSRKTILVIGATGAQGGSVARALLERGSFNVRAFTRKPDSPAALELASRGAGIAAGDLDDRDSIAAALDGVHGVFGVTNFWEHFEKEEEEGRNLIRAVADAEVPHFVFSTLPAIEKATDGALHSPHFDIKAELEQYARALSVPATFVHMPMYYESFVPLLKPDGDAFAMRIPMGTSPLAMMSVSDLGFSRTRTCQRCRPRRESRATRTSRAERARAHRPSRAESIETWRVIAPELQKFETWAVRNQQKLRLALGVRETAAV